jgi:hypothetical protein
VKWLPVRVTASPPPVEPWFGETGIGALPESIGSTDGRVPGRPFVDDHSDPTMLSTTLITIRDNSYGLMSPERGAC